MMVAHRTPCSTHPSHLISLSHITRWRQYRQARHTIPRWLRRDCSRGGAPRVRIAMGSDSDLQLLPWGCPMLPLLSRMTMATMMRMRNPSGLHLVARFAKPADYMHSMRMRCFIRRTEVHRPKPTLNNSIRKSAYVDPSWWWDMHGIIMYIFPCFTVFYFWLAFFLLACRYDLHTYWFCVFLVPTKSSGQDFCFCRKHLCHEGWSQDGLAFGQLTFAKAAAVTCTNVRN